MRSAHCACRNAKRELEPPFRIEHKPGLRGEVFCEQPLRDLPAYPISATCHKTQHAQTGQQHGTGFGFGNNG